jgi:hypothetical protein
MKALAVALSLCLAAPAPASVSTGTAGGLEPITVAASREPDAAAQLKTVRAAGAVAATSGAGLFVYGILFGAAGPIGWAAGLLFFGGMTAYLSGRALEGEDDFRPGPPPPPRGRPHATQSPHVQHP